MRFQDFVKANPVRDADAKAEELPHLHNTHELALVIVAGTVICADVAANMPEHLHDQAIDAIVDQVQTHVDRYIKHRDAILRGES